MGKLCTKYHKFMATAASAALVASAIAPVASAKDFKDTEDNTHEAAIDALSDADVITGYEDGTFKPNKTLTRQDVIKLMGKWLVSEGYKVPTDYKTNPRFADLKTTSNDELLQYAALVKDNGLFVGTTDGKLNPAGNITRENMAIVLVRAFDRVHDIDLATYVAGQDFKKNVNDLGKAKVEARPAIDVLDFFDITNPAAPAFNPKSTTTRGHFATFLHKFSTADFSVMKSDVVAPGDATVKTINATTVEVTFKSTVENVNSLNFTIEGLTVSNAVVKQSDNQTVVLTTAVQDGGKEYTVSLDGKEIGKFKGVSAVVPAKIVITTQSVQGKTGQQAIFSADVGVKQAGIPVTFNVQAQPDTLNKNQLFEVLTNAEGIATFSYTQYSAGNDYVTTYLTGAPTVRDAATVHWGVDTILDITSDDKKGNNVNNAENKVYKVTYKDPKTGKVLPNQRLHVTFAENVNTTIDKVSKATVNGVTPMQLTTGTAPETAVIMTDNKGEATFTVSGSNTAITPVVFVETELKNATTYESSNLQAKADQVTFSATQAEYTIDIFGSFGEDPHAAIGFENGREYTIMVLNKDGEPAANEVVNIAFSEDLDRNIATNTDTWFLDLTDGYTNKKQISYKTNEYGELIFTIVSDRVGDYATPIAWIDVNSANAAEGKLDEGEPFQIGPITYFEKEMPTYGSLFVTDGNGAVPRTDKKAFLGDEKATIEYFASNQSFFPFDLPAEYSHIDASFTIWNTGAEDIKVSYTTKFEEVHTEIISPNRSYTTPTISGSRYENPVVTVETIGDTSTSVKVVGSAVAQPDKSLVNNSATPINLGITDATFEFVSTRSVGALYNGFVTDINTLTKQITFAGKSPIGYANAIYKSNNSIVSQDWFESTIASNLGAAQVTYKVEDEKVIFYFLPLPTNHFSEFSSVNNAVRVDQVVDALKEAAKINKAVLDTAAGTLTLTFDENISLSSDVTKSAISFTSDGVLETIGGTTATVLNANELILNLSNVATSSLKINSILQMVVLYDQNDSIVTVLDQANPTPNQSLLTDLNSKIQ